MILINLAFSTLGCFSVFGIWGAGRKTEGVKSACKLVRQHLINQPVLFNPGFASKNLTADADMEMGFTFRAASSVADMIG